MNINQPAVLAQLSYLRNLTLAALLVLACFATARAQWTTSNNDIYNSNSGNVGIGTNGAASSLLEVKKSQSAGTIITVDNPFTTASNSAYSGLFFKQNGANRLLVSSTNDNHGTITPGTAQFWNYANAPTVFATNNTEQMRITAAGNVGIGVNAPDSKLQVHHFSNNTNLSNLGYPDLAFAFRNTSNTNNNMSLISFQDAAGWGNAQIGAVQRDQSTHIADLVFFARNSGTALAERMRIRGDGKVGIGLNLPTAQLHVMASDGEALRIYRNANSANFGVAQYFSLNNSSGVAIDYAQISGGISDNTAGAEKGALAFYTRGAGSVAERMRITDTGNVGIGVPSPTTKLDVNGTVNATGFTVGGSALVGSQWATSGTTINYAAGNVGIGVSPTTKLDVNGTVNATAFTVGGAALVGSQWATSGTTINYATGNVGIATLNPTEKLHVTGNVKVIGDLDVTGNVKAKYQDVAEWVETSQELRAGTVVILDSNKTNQVIASSQAYDSRVAGVISMKPGLELGEPGEGRVLVATTGRVKVKVDATNGPIQIGDLLVTSDKEGFAMKSVPVELGGVRLHRPGTLIGKALEPLTGGTGEILVLLSLQ